MSPAPDLVTASYRSYRVEMGVPLATSIGKNKNFSHAPEVRSLMPWGVFRVLDHLPVEEQAKAYRASLWRRQHRVYRDLAEVAECYPGQPLVILCWCSTATALDGACHRRWAADWLTETLGVDVPEVV